MKTLERCRAVELAIVIALLLAHLLLLVRAASAQRDSAGQMLTQTLPMVEISVLVVLAVLGRGCRRLQLAFGLLAICSLVVFTVQLGLTSSDTQLLARTAAVELTIVLGICLSLRWCGYRLFAHQPVGRAGASFPLSRLLLAVTVLGALLAVARASRQEWRELDRVDPQVAAVFVGLGFGLATVASMWELLRPAMPFVRLPLLMLILILSTLLPTWICRQDEHWASVAAWSVVHGLVVTMTLGALRISGLVLSSPRERGPQPVPRPEARIPNLDSVEVGTPCSANWESMIGDDRVRFCGDCQLKVYNLSAMTREAATELVQARGGRVCVRFYRRADGTLLTQDCPVGLRAVRMRIARACAAMAALAAAFLALGHLVGGKSPTSARTSGPSVRRHDWSREPVKRLADWGPPEFVFVGSLVSPPITIVPEEPEE